MFLFFLSSTLNFRNLSKKTENLSSSGARNWTIIGISFAGCFLFALYLIYDLQLIMGENAFSFSFRASLSGTNPCILRMNARGGWPVGKRKGPRRRPDGRGIDVEVERERPQAEKNPLLKKKYLTFVGGKTVALGPDEYVFASLSIYLDVINIFLMILQLVAAFQRQ
jgi:FtsH-binding integral membrane protein